MKRFLALALAVVLVMGFAAVASADLVFKGKYEFTGTSTNNTTDLNDDLADRQTVMHQRLRLHLNANVADDVTVNTRFTVSNADFDGATTTGGNVQTTDWAYMTMKNFGGSFTIGRQPASWGNGFQVKGAIKDRIKYVTKLNDALTLGAVMQKNNETYNGTGGGDSDSYYVLAVVKPVADHKIAIIYSTTNNNTAADADGSWIDIAYNGKAGPVGIAAEYTSVDNDAWTDAKSGFFVAGMMSVSDSIGVSLAYAVANNGWSADNDFSPTLMFGTEGSPNAIMEFGDSVGAAADNKATGLVLGATFKLSDDLTAGVNFALATLDDLAEEDGTELDLYADYKLASNTNLRLGYAQLAVDLPVGDADDVTTAAMEIVTKF